MRNLVRILSLLLLAALLMSAVVFGGRQEPLPGQRPKLIVGDDINYPPYSYIDENGKPAGFNVELARFVGEAMGYDVEIRLDEWNKVRAALESGEIDVISGLFYSAQRAQVYGFSVKHSVTSGAIFAGRSRHVDSLEDLRGKTVVVQKGDIVAEFLAAQDLGIILHEAPTVAEALRLVDSGEFDYAGVLRLPGLYTVRELGLKRAVAQDLILHPNDYCMAVRQGNDQLLQMLNGGLQVAKATGDFERIYNKWLGVYETPEPYRLLKKYGWVMLSAFGALVLLMLWNTALRRQVGLRTAQLETANRSLQEQQEELTASHEEMEASLEELMAIEEELREQYEKIIQSEAQLRISEERNRAMIQALPDILFVLDGDGRFLDCQTGSPERLFAPKEAFLGRTLAEIMPPEIAEQGLAKIRLALETGEIQHFEYSLSIGDTLSHYELRLSRSQANEVIGITRNITRRIEYQQQIEYLSYHDQLTGLYNRRFFEEELARLDVPRNLPLCIIMADVNGLKLINDSFGHRMGDELLIKVAGLLKRVCRAGELIFRIGGDEFVILLPQLPDQRADELIRRIQEACAQERVASLDLSVSFGWEAKRQPEEDIHEVFNQAEDYMYKKKLFEGPSMRGKTIGAIVNALHEKNHREEQHSQRVACLARELAVALGLSERDVNEIDSAALLHDIGKIGITEYLLNKAGALTPEELAEVRRHPEIGYRILSSVNDMADIADYVLSHHERWDGGGYPRGLAGDRIPLQARIIAIADAYDAMTSERSYRTPVTPEAAGEELLRHSGTQFDPALVPVFIEAVVRVDDTTLCV